MLKPVQSSPTSEWSTLKALWPYIWPRGRTDLKLRVVLALFMLVLAKLATVAVPYFYKWAVDGLTAEPVPVSTILFTVPVMMVVAYAVGRVLMVLFVQVRDALFAKVGQHAVRALARKTFAHLHDLSLRFHLERRTGGLSRVIERGTKGIETVIRFTLLSSVPTVLELAFVGAILGYHFSLTYLGVIAVAVVAYVWFTIAASEWRLGIRRIMNESDTQANSKAIDSLLNYETVKYFGNERWETERFDRSMARYEQAAIRTHTSLAVLNSGQVIIFTAAMGLCMAMAAGDVAAGRLTVGDFVMVNALLIQLYQPLNFMGMVYREIKQGLIDIEHMFELLGRTPEIRDAPGAEELVVARGGIRFEHVDFSYEDDRQILKDVSFTVPPGRTVAIVGPSGAGKSTISRILFRFYDISAGRVLIDGQDIAAATQESVRAAVGMVPQDTVLFNDTVAYNIRYGRPDASDAEVREAARMARIEEFIDSLPLGFQTEVGERGLKLSGGEKQRIAIARAILKAPPILILDEATSALDSNTERGIQEALRRVARGRTTLVIAHRLTTIVDADEIIVLAAGRIVARGRHEELLEQGGLYAQMWDRQRQAEHAGALLAGADGGPAPALDAGLDPDRPDPDRPDPDRVHAGID